MARSGGESTCPVAEAACTKKRFGHVGPGCEANQWSQMTNSFASALRTGRLAASKHCIGVSGGELGYLRTKFATNPLPSRGGYTPPGKTPLSYLNVPSAFS